MKTSVPCLAELFETDFLLKNRTNTQLLVLSESSVFLLNSLNALTIGLLIFLG